MLSHGGAVETLQDHIMFGIVVRVWYGDVLEQTDMKIYLTSHKYYKVNF